MLKSLGLFVFTNYIQNSDYTGVYGWNLFYSSMLKGVYLRK